MVHALDKQANFAPRAGVRFLPHTLGVWFLYIVGYAALSFGHFEVALGVFTTTVQISLDLLAFGAAAWFSRVHRGPAQRHFILIAVASLGLALTNAFWGVLFNILGETKSAGLADLSFRIPFVITTLAWLGFWSLQLARDSARNLSAQAIAVIVAVAALAIVIFLTTYIPLLSVETPDYVHVFVLVYASIELAALILCACAAILKAHGYPTLLGAGFFLFVATDFLFNSSELTGSLEPNELAEIPWVLAEACLAAGVFALNDQLRESAADHAGRNDEAELYAHNMMPVLLLAGLVGASVLVTYALVGAVEVRVFVALLLVGMMVLSANQLAQMHGEAVRSAVSSDALLAGGSAQVRHPWVLHALGSYRPVMAIRQSLLTMRSTTVRVGRNFGFRAAASWAEPQPKTIFLAMPYTKQWSEDVFEVLRQAASAAGWQLHRGDKKYGEQDLLMNIWTELCDNEIVLADITDHTPNVLYEVGIAHGLGKPVVLVARLGVLLPFDLSVKRTIFYEYGAPHWRKRLAKDVQEMLQGMAKHACT